MIINEKILLVILVLFNLESYSSYILIPMDDSQSNHLKSYGIAFLSLQNDAKVAYLIIKEGFLIKHYLELKKNV